MKAVVGTYPIPTKYREMREQLDAGIGGLIAFIRSPGKRAFGFLKEIAAGVMISVAFLEFFEVAWEPGGAIFVFLFSGIFGV